MPVDRGTVALAGVRAARQELWRASGLLRRAIALAATQDVSPEALARAAGTSVDRVRRIAAEPGDGIAAGGGAVPGDGAGHSAGTAAGDGAVPEDGAGRSAGTAADRGGWS